MKLANTLNMNAAKQSISNALANNVSITGIDMIEKFLPASSSNWHNLWFFISLSYPFLVAKCHKKYASFWRDFGKFNLINLIVLPILCYSLITFWIYFSNGNYRYPQTRLIFYLNLPLLVIPIAPIIYFPAGLYFIVKGYPWWSKILLNYPLALLVNFIMFSLAFWIPLGSYAFIRSRSKRPLLSKRNVWAYFAYFLYWSFGTLALFIWSFNS